MASLNPAALPVAFGRRDARRLMGNTVRPSLRRVCRAAARQAEPAHLLDVGKTVAPR